MKIQKLDTKDVPALINLLSHFDLVIEDIDIVKQIFFGLKYNHRYVAAGGLELSLPYALLRSVAVCPHHHGKGYAKIVCEALIETALNENIRDLYLLTETAEGFFSRLGFIPVDRSLIPPEIRITRQFSKLCPGDAVVMKKQLTP